MVCPSLLGDDPLALSRGIDASAVYRLTFLYTIYTSVRVSHYERVRANADTKCITKIIANEFYKLSLASTIQLLSPAYASPAYASRFGR